jgi:hypothetical protein
MKKSKITEYGEEYTQIELVANCLPEDVNNIRNYTSYTKKYIDSSIPRMKFICLVNSFRGQSPSFDQQIFYFKYGRLHNEFGPASILKSSVTDNIWTRGHYLNGCYITYDEFRIFYEAEVKRRKTLRDRKKKLKKLFV